MARAQSCQNDVQHIGRLSRTCLVTWCEGTAQLVQFDRAEITVISALFKWLKPLTDEEMEETRVPGVISDDKLQNMILRLEDSNPQQRLESALQHWWQAVAKRENVLTITPYDRWCRVCIRVFVQTTQTKPWAADKHPLKLRLPAARNLQLWKPFNHCSVQQSQLKITFDCYANTQIFIK